MPAPSIEHGDAVDLDIGAGSMQHTAETGSRDLLAREVLAEGFVEAGEIGHVPQNDTHVDNVLRRRTCGLEYAHQIVECLTCLHHDIARNHGASGGIERALA